MTKLLINGLELFGYHGVFDFEQEKGQPFLIHCEITLEDLSAIQDELSETVSYADCVEVIKKVFFRGTHQLLEHLGNEICGELFSFDSRIFEISLTILKLEPPVEDSLQSLGVKLCRTRSS